MGLLKNHGHGGDVYAASRELRRGIDHLIDFSASINPLGPSPRALRAITQARRYLHHYPDPNCWALRQALASHWKRDPGQIVIGNGSTEIIHVLPHALQIRHLLVIGPMFSEYANAMARSGGRVSTVLADRADGYVPPLDRAIRLMRAGGTNGKGRHMINAVVLCNPNSPTGQTCGAAEVTMLARVAARHRIHLIVDETFAEYCEDRSILPDAIAATRAIVLRSFTKFYGLPGLRVGYAIAQAKVAQRMRACQPPWSVNALAQEAALAALNDIRHAERSRSFMARERARFTTLLRKLQGCSLFPSHVNFVLMELPVGWQARKLTAVLRRQGILIRDCSTVPGLNARSVRMAVRTRTENDRLVRALSRLLRRG